MKATRDVKRAYGLYSRFREATPRTAKTVTLKLPRAVMVMGHVEAIDYSTTHAGKLHRYRHKFARGSRPILAAGPGRNQLVMLGGRYHVTERGIVDLSPRGREIED